MSSRPNFAALLLMIVQVLFIQQIFAESPRANQQSPEQTLVKANTNDDAIQQFVRADFAQRRTMLNQWPASIEELDKLVAYVEKDELYTDSSGNTYIMKDGDKLFNYPQNQNITDWPADLNQVTLVNTLRKALSFGQAKIKLQSEDASLRLAAIDILENNLDELDIKVVNQLYLDEKNNKVKARLKQLKARIDFNSPDILTKIQATKILKESNRPDVLAIIEQELQQPNLNPELKTTLIDAKSSIKTRLQASEWAGHVFSGLSTASILLLAALGLAITYGLLGVINMAHGELIMIGAYTTYVVQSFFKTHFSAYVDWYLIAAIPAAFLVSALIGMLIERTVIRPLYGRQLETLLATFGVSLILMQLVRMIFGAQNVEVSNISWLSGGISITPSLMLPYNRIAIIVFTIAVLSLLIYLLNKTRFGLFVRAVTQNRQMARAVGIRSARMDMMAIGLG